MSDILREMKSKRRVIMQWTLRHGKKKTYILISIINYTSLGSTRNNLGKKKRKQNKP